MLCPHCQAAGQRSVVDIVRCTQGKDPKRTFWDEDGVEHHHNPNVSVTEYRCSNGHTFAERSSWECQCGYKVCEAEIVTTPAAIEQMADEVRRVRRKPGLSPEQEAERESKKKRAKR